MTEFSADDEIWMRRALELAGRGYGRTSPNPMVGAVLVRGGKALGEGWHHRAGEPHAEIEAMNEARAKRRRLKGATLYVTLEPCSTEGRTPACTDALIKAGLEKVVVAATDPNPRHAGRGFEQLRQAGLVVSTGLCQADSEKLNESFNHWIVRQTPFVTVKAAMTLDGKIATAAGDSKWITGAQARAHGMHLRQGADAILVGLNTVIQDDPSLTIRRETETKDSIENEGPPRLRRIVLDTHARTPLKARLVCDEQARLTTIVVAKGAPDERVAALEKKVNVLRAPLYEGRIDLKWLLRTLGAEEVTNLLVEGGGEVNASFLLQGMAHRLAFFYAPKIVGGFRAAKAVGGVGMDSPEKVVRLEDSVWQRMGPDLLLTAKIRHLPARGPRRSRHPSSRRRRPGQSTETASASSPDA